MRRAFLAVLLLSLALPAAALGVWKEPVHLADGASEPHIALADDGSAIAVWRTRTSIRSAQRAPNEKAFAAASTVARGRFSLLRLSEGSEGRAVALWRSRRGRLFASVREPGRRFGAPRRIATAHGIFVPDVKVSANGIAFAVWEEQLRSKALRIRAARLPADRSRFGTPFTVRKGAAVPRIDIGESGEAMVVYSVSRPKHGLGIRRISPTGALGAEQFVQTAAGVYRVTVGAAGHALLTWTTFNEGLDALHAAYAAPGEPFGAAQDLAEDVGRLGIGAGVDAQGNATVLWIGLDAGTTTYHVRVATRRATDPFSLPPIDLADGYFDYPRLAVNPRGDAIAAWWGDVGQRFRHLAAARPRFTGQWSDTTVLGSAAQGNDFAPDVSIDGLGRAVAVWLASPDRARRGVGRLFFADYVPD